MFISLYFTVRWELLAAVALESVACLQPPSAFAPYSVSYGDDVLSLQVLLQQVLQS